MAETRTLSKREMTLPSFPSLTFGEAEPQEVFHRAFTKHMGDIATFEEEARRYVYDNPKATQRDFLIHCHWLASLIAQGQLLLSLIQDWRLEEMEPECRLLRQKADEFILRLHDWHSPAGSHAGEPPASKQAMAEVAAGQVEDPKL